MTIDISILLCTYRKGGLNISFQGLLNQTFPKERFELILIDIWHKDRKAAVKKLLGKSGRDKINYIHTYPARTLWPVDSGSMHRNSAIALAEGELCVFFCDYMYVQPSYLQEYWNVFEASRPATPIGPHRYWQCPAVIDDWQKKKAGLSLFKDEWTPAQLTTPWAGGPDADPKMSMPGGSIPGNYFHMKNETARLDALLAVNGCDEAFDGGHCYSDIELGARLERANNGFLNHTGNIGEIVQIREIYPVCQRPRSVQDDFDYWGSRNGAATSPNPYNLAEWREECLEWKKKELKKSG